MGLTKRLKTRSINTTMATLIMAFPRVSGRLDGGSSGSVPQVNSSECPELKALAPGRPLQQVIPQLTGRAMEATGLDKVRATHCRV